MAQALLSIARDDPDTVWLVLHLQLGSYQNELDPNPDARIFPNGSKLLHDTFTNRWTAAGDPASFRASVTALAKEVASMQAQWHRQCSAD